MRRGPSWTHLQLKLKSSTLHGPLLYLSLAGEANGSISKSTLLPPKLTSTKAVLKSQVMGLPIDQA